MAEPGAMFADKRTQREGKAAQIRKAELAEKGAGEHKGGKG